MYECDICMRDFNSEKNYVIHVEKCSKQRERSARSTRSTRSTRSIRSSSVIPVRSRIYKSENEMVSDTGHMSANDKYVQAIAKLRHERKSLKNQLTDTENEMRKKEDYLESQIATLTLDRDTLADDLEEQIHKRENDSGFAQAKLKKKYTKKLAKIQFESEKFKTKVLELERQIVDMERNSRGNQELASKIMQLERDNSDLTAKLVFTQSSTQTTIDQLTKHIETVQKSLEEAQREQEKITNELTKQLEDGVNREKKTKEYHQTHIKRLQESFNSELEKSKTFQSQQLEKSTDMYTKEIQLLTQKVRKSIEDSNTMEKNHKIVLFKLTEELERYKISIQEHKKSQQIMTEEYYKSHQTLLEEHNKAQQKVTEEYERQQVQYLREKDEWSGEKTDLNRHIKLLQNDLEKCKIDSMRSIKLQEQHIDGYKRKYENGESKIKSLTNNNQELTSKIAHLQSEIHKSKSSASQIINDKNKEITDLKNDIEQNYVRNIEEYKRSIHQQNTRLSDTEKEYKEIIERKDMAYKKLESELIQTVDNMKELEITTSRLRVNFSQAMNKVTFENKSNIDIMNTHRESLESRISQYKKDIDHLDKLIGQKNFELKNVDNKMTKLDKEMTETIFQKQREINNLNGSVAEKESHIQHIQKVNESYSKKINQLNKDIDTLITEVNKKKEMCDSYENKIAKMQKSYEALELNVTSHKDLIKNKEDKIRSLYDSVKQLQIDAKSKDILIGQHNTTMVALQNVIKQEKELNRQVTSVRNEQDEKNTKLNNIITTLTQELQNSRDLIEKQNAKLVSMNVAENENQKQFSDMQQTIQNRNSELRKLSDINNILSDAMKSMNSDSDIKVNELRQLRYDNNVLSSDVSKQKIVITKHENEIVQLKSSNTKLSKSMRDQKILEQHITELKSQLSGSQEKLEKALLTYDNTVKKHDEKIKDTVRRHEDHVDNLQNIKIALTDKLANMTHLCSVEEKKNIELHDINKKLGQALKENSGYKELFDDTKISLESLKIKYAEVSRKNVNLEQLNSTLVSGVDTNNEYRKQLLNTIDNMKIENEKLANVAYSNSIEKDILTTLQKQLVELTENYTKEHDELESQRKEIQLLRSDNKDKKELQNDLQSLILELDTARNHLTEIREQYKGCNNERESLKSRLEMFADKYTSTKEALEKEVSSLKHKLNTSVNQIKNNAVEYNKVKVFADKYTSTKEALEICEKKLAESSQQIIVHRKKIEKLDMEGSQARNLCELKIQEKSLEIQENRHEMAQLRHELRLARK